MDAPTAGVLRDVAILVWMALLLGAGVYEWLRLARPALAWNWGGQVNARPYNMLDAAMVTVVSMFLLTRLQAAKVTEEAGNVELSAAPLLGSMVLTLVVCALLLGYLIGIRGLHPVELFGLRRLSVFHSLAIAVVYMLPVWIVVSIVANAAAYWMRGFWPDLHAQEMVEAFRGSENLMAKALMVVAATVVAPLVEETLFRGFLYGVIKRYTDSYFAAVCSSLLFAVVHFHVASFFPLTVLALAFCLAYEITGSLLVTMLMHAIFNTTSLVLMVLFNEVT